ncbi:MAG: ChbG/HpnK family deacetylase [Rhodospirillaceae bacterium]|nr:MAG: ChbG/HpnK family deacetylase [Rhodospirillaceae bacterium]
MKHVIFTADDFGLTPEVNAAVARAHRDGVLTAASLMIAAPAAQEAVNLARMLPGLGVGLHVVVADGRPLLPPDQIPALVDRTGALPSNLAAAGIHWFFSPAARVQLRREIEAQFAAFLATGLVCDHVNAHNHMHLHPTVLGIVMDCAVANGIRHIRLPYEPPSLAGGDMGARLGGLALTPWTALMRSRFARAGLVCNDRLAGLSATGHMTEARVLAALDAVEDGVTEFYFHPAEWATPELERAAPGYDRAGELAALTSPAVARRLQDLGINSCFFRGLP